jgi:hypothetical protein
MTPRQLQRRRQFLAPTTIVIAFLALVGSLGLTTASSASAAAGATPYCGITWGSLDKTGGAGTTAATMAGVRTGRHDCYDRLVLDLRGGTSAGFHVGYVDAVYNDPRGDLIPLRGGARLLIVVKAPSPGTPAAATELADVTGYTTFRQVAYAGSFEGQTSLGLGVRARLPFRAFVLTGPGDGSRLVVDVAHRW